MNKKISVLLAILSVIVSFVMGILLSSQFIEEPAVDTVYTLTLIHVDGEAISPQTFDQAFDLELPILVQDGYTFLGWFEGNTKVEEGTFERSLTLVAKFQINTYVLTFSVEDAQPMSAFYEQEPFLPISNKVGHVFVGWYVDSLLTTEFNGIVTQSLTLYPKFEALGQNSFAHYYLSEFEGLVLSKVVDRDTVVELPLLSKEGYTFIGWKVSDTGILVNENQIINENAVLIAFFEPLIKTYTISFNTGQAEAIASVEIEEGDMLTLPENPILFGYQFIGWITDIGFDGFNVSSTLITESFAVEKDMVLFANFDYMIPSSSIFYEPFRFGNRILGYTITEIDYDSDEMIDYLILPQTYLGLPVVAITSYAFQGIRYIKEVVVPEGYIEIGSGAFYESSIQTIHLPQSLEVLANAVFSNSDIETVVFAEQSKLVSIGNNVFYQASLLKTIFIPNTVKFIGSQAFENSGLESIVFEDNSSLLSISYNAFRSTKIVTIDLPNSLTSIGYYAFSDSLLTEIHFKENLSRIEFNAFADTPIEEVSFSHPERITKLGYNIFQNTPLMLEESMLFIDNLAFGYHQDLVTPFELVIPEQITFIAEDAFYNANISTLTFLTPFVDSFISTFQNSTIETIVNLPESRMFQYTFANANITGTFELTLPVNAHSYNNMFSYTNMNNVDVIFEQSMENADLYGMFQGTGVNALHLGSGVTHVSAYMFYTLRVNHLDMQASEIYVDELGFSLSVLNSYTLHPNVRFIPLDDNAFRDLFFRNFLFVNVDGYQTFGNVLIDTNLVSGVDLIIPDGIHIINSFALARNFSTIDFNDTEFILRHAFQRQNALYLLNPTITIPSTVTYVHPDIKTSWEDRPLTILFEGFSDFEVSEIHIDRINKYSMLYRDVAFDSNGFKRIGNMIYDYDVENFGRDVVIPEGVTVIARETFYNLDITSISHTTPIEYIGNDALSINLSLRNIIIAKRASNNSYVIYEDTLTDVPPTFDGLIDTDFTVFNNFEFESFSRNANLSPDENGFIIHNNILFRYRGTDKDVVIPEGILVIAHYAFSNTLVETITLPDSLMWIGDYVFYNTPRLHTLIYSETLYLDRIGYGNIDQSLLSITELPQSLFMFTKSSDQALSFNSND